MADLNGRGYLIFGGTSEIGLATARRLAERGARIFLAGRNEEALTAAAAPLQATTLLADPARPETLPQAVEAAAAQCDHLSGAVNCFGTVLLKPAHLTTDEEWQETLSVNLTSAFAITRAMVRALGKDGGSIVFISTVAARIGLPNHEAIAAAKAGLHGLALSAAATYAPKSIRFNVVAPGLTRTPLTQKITGNEAALKASTAMHPLGRIGEADDVASAVAWFLDPAQSWVTGQILGVDGGLGSVRGRG
jgi:NAD(P)-dependent dehydrogenase (short-subunit alcohol dehydrogenase family)